MKHMKYLTTLLIVLLTLSISMDLILTNVLPASVQAAPLAGDPTLNTTIDGTTGVPLGGWGTGSIKFWAARGTFSSVETTPALVNNFQTMPNTQLQLYTKQGGTVQTNSQLKATLSNGRYSDDAIFPVHSVNFGTTNGVSVNLTAFAAFNMTNVNDMTNPYAFYSFSVNNTTSSSVDTALAFQLGSSANTTDTYVSGKGFTTSTSVGIGHALYASSSDGSAIISAGNDNGFFTTGVLNNSVSGNVNKTAVKLTLPAHSTQTLKFVYAWYNAASNFPQSYYYVNNFANAAAVATYGLSQFTTLYNNATSFVTRMRGSNIPIWFTNYTVNSLATLVNNSVYTKDGRLSYGEGNGFGTYGTMDQMWLARQVISEFFPSLAYQELEFWARTQRSTGQIHHDNQSNPGVLVAWDDTTHSDYRVIDSWVDLNVGFIVGVYETYIATNTTSELSYFWPYVQKAGQRILDQVTTYGNKTYPYTFDGTGSSYDAGGNSDIYNAGISADAYEIMAKLAGIEGNTSLQTTYNNAFTTVNQSFTQRYLNNNFLACSNGYCENALAGAWLASFLGFGQLYPTANLNYGIQQLTNYYNPLSNGMGTGSGYGTWQPYLIDHYGGLLQETGQSDLWYAMASDLVNRKFLDRDHVFNQGLGLFPQQTSLTFATSIDGAWGYLSIPAIWRDYSTLVGYHRNAQSGELWVEPNLPSAMNHQLTNALFLSPEGPGTISAQQSGNLSQNQTLKVTSDNAITVKTLYVKDTAAASVIVTVNGVNQSFTRIGTGYSKELQIPWSGTINASGITIQVTYASSSGTPTPTGGIAINSGGSATGSFVADTDYTGGSPYSSAATVTTTGVNNPAAQAVYQTERYGNFTYTIPNLTPGGSYTVRLHFAELYWTASGKRTFNVFINGMQVLGNFDIFAAAGGQNKAIVEQFTAVANSSGAIAIQYANVVDQAKSSGIEVIPDLSGVHSIPNVHSGLVLEDKASGTGNGAVVDQWSSNGGDNQLWNITAVENHYEITNVHSGLVLEDQANGAGNGAVVDQWSSNGGDNQLWQIA
jgi:Malectin domain/Ricin-type beta-trefoil lectin domain-like/beta-glucosidase 2, glycosyl-hydrolase family 116 N-term/Glycosyl-hydrolase family 116, catalytic region